MLNIILTTFVIADAVMSRSEGRASNDLCLLQYRHTELGCTGCHIIGTKGPCGRDQTYQVIPDDFNTELINGDALGWGCKSRHDEPEFIELDSLYERTSNGELQFRDSASASAINESGTASPNINICVETEQVCEDQSDQRFGYCVWDSPEHPCHGSPANYRYSNETHQCYPVHTSAYCPEMMYLFYPEYSLAVQDKWMSDGIASGKFSEDTGIIVLLSLLGAGNYPDTEEGQERRYGQCYHLMILKLWEASHVFALMYRARG